MKLMWHGALVIGTTKHNGSLDLPGFDPTVGR